MKFQGREVLLCNCERTMRLDGKAIAEALGADAAPRIHEHLCRAGIAAFEATLEGDGEVLVACTQEAPLFSELAGEHGAGERIAYTNIRERAGWSEAGGEATPKIAALLAEAGIQVRPAGLQTMVSDGVCLVYGAGQEALDAAASLAQRLSVTLLLSGGEADFIPPGRADFGIYRGRITSASGALGTFEIVVDGYAPMLPSSRDEPAFVVARDGARSECALILDISGDTPLFPGADRRDGYLRADPRDPAAVARALFEISGLVGEFEKPIYIRYNAEICVHSRSRITGCTNCLDACPLGAIASTGDHVAIDNAVCGGCGNCSAVCPTGAVSYDFPRREDMVRRISALVGTYIRAGGTAPRLLVHDEAHGSALIGAMARFGRGLPANVLPLSVFSVMEFGHDLMAAAFAAGVEDIVLLASPKLAEELPPLEGQAALMNRIMAGLGHEGERVRILAEADPDALEASLFGLGQHAPMPAGEPLARGGKREIARAALARLNETAPQPAEIVALDAGAPYGRIHVDADGCTLCLACVSACPADAILDNPDKPQIRFVEQACVQCGLCAKTCPEKVITLEPRLNFLPSALSPILLNEEEPFACISCGKPFGTRKTIDHVVERLKGRHWMFQDETAVKLIQMCDDCRIQIQAEGGNDPFRMGERPRVRTTEDYIEARKEGRDLGVEDFLAED